MVNHTLTQKEGDHLLVAFPARLHEGGVALVVDLLDVSAPLQQEHGQLDVTSTGCQRQGRLEAVRRHVDLRACS